ncbi:MAG: hypothetical protein Q8R69_24615 [Telluria sp.]|nr:hypothetical protein [Telluria sp.]
MNTRAASCQRPPPSPPYRVASMNQPQSWKTIAILAVTQVVSWGSLYYAFAILGPDIARELGWRAETVFGAFSWSLLVAGLASTPAQASSDAGLGPIAAFPPGQRGAGDVQFVAPYVDSLDGLGVSGRGSHSPNEELDLASLERATIRSAILIYRLTR